MRFRHGVQSWAVANGNTESHGAKAVSRSTAKPSAKTNHKVVAGEEIIFDVAEPKPAEALVGEDIPLDVVYDDKDLAIINKPGGL